MKHFEYEIDDRLLDIALRAVRTKKDLLLLLTYTVKSIIEQELLKKDGYEINIKDNRKLVIYVDKMNRVIYCLENKIFTYQMPFNISVSEDGEFILKFKHFMVIDSFISSVLITVFEDEYCFEGTLIDIYERIDELMKSNYDGIGINEDEVWELVKHLMIYEPGYIRYDDDPDPSRMDLQLHPRYHLDINYETASSYKIGLINELNPKKLLSVIDNTQKCATLVID